MSRVERIRQILQGRFAPDFLHVRDDSHHHAGHAGAADGRGHFSVELVSAEFAGLSAVARHRAVYAALQDMMKSDIHALAIDARAPGES